MTIDITREQIEELRKKVHAAQNPNDAKELTRYHCTEEAAELGRFVLRHADGILAAAERVGELEESARDLCDAVIRDQRHMAALEGDLDNHRQSLAAERETCRRWEEKCRQFEAKVERLEEHVAQSREDAEEFAEVCDEVETEERQERYDAQAKLSEERRLYIKELQGHLEKERKRCRLLESSRDEARTKAAELADEREMYRGTADMLDGQRHEALAERDRAVVVERERILSRLDHYTADQLRRELEGGGGMPENPIKGPVRLDRAESAGD